MLNPAQGEQPMQAFVEARYEYHWAPLLGCLVGQLAHLGATQPSHVIGAATGISYQPPQDAGLPELLEDGLAVLGVSARITYLSHPNRLQRFRVRRRIRQELRAGRAVATYGVGVSAFGPVWGLIVGVDDARGAWRRDGPMTEQVSPWLPETEFNAAPAVIAVVARRSGASVPERLPQVASDAMAGALDRARRDLLDRIEVLNSAVEVEAQRYSYEAQALAANWGEAATFWRELRHDRYTPMAQQMAVTLSRFATLFPYPMGGQPNNPGVRTAAVHTLREVLDILPDLR